MAKLLTMTLILHGGSMLNGLHVRQGHVTNAHSKSDAEVDEVPATPKQATALFDLAGCITRMPYLQYMAYTAASYCRTYLYSCNNLWPEELHREVKEGTFCFINAYEQNTAEKDRIAGFEKFHAFTSTTIQPFFSFMDTYFEYSNKKTLMDGKVYADGESMALRKLHPQNDAPKDGERQLCQDASDKLRCMIQIMKRRLSEEGNSKPDLSKLSPDQGTELLGKLENVTNGLALFEEARRVLTRPDSAFILQEGFGGSKGPVKGPLTTALGTEKYTPFSLPYGHVGKISPTRRYPHDAVQQGLVMSKFDLATMNPRAVCNDGSNAIMYMKEHPTEKTKWHFHIDGGFFCFDEKTCMQRAHESTGMVSVKSFEQEKNNSGMFDPIMGGFPDYTHATAVYCSSDAWMGQVEVEDFQLVEGTTLSNGAPGTYFHGYFITEAILMKFIDMGMGSTPGHELWVSGCSAGSIAATAMADSWKPRLQALGIPHVPTIWTMLDNAPITSPPSIAENPSIYKMAMTLVNFLYKPSRNVSAGVFVNQGCASAFSANVGHCIFPGVGILYINIPNIVLNQLWDNFVLAKTYGFMHPMTSLQYNTGMIVVNATKEIFKTVSNHQNYWAISCGDHCMSSNPNFWRLVPNTGNEQISARDMVIQTREGALGRGGMLGRVVCDECAHYNCGCVGQSSSMNRLALNSMFFKVMEKLAPGYPSIVKILPMTLPITTAIAADIRSPTP